MTIHTLAGKLLAFTGNPRKQFTALLTGRRGTKAGLSKPGELHPPRSHTGEQDNEGTLAVSFCPLGPGYNETKSTAGTHALLWVCMYPGPWGGTAGEFLPAGNFECAQEKNDSKYTMQVQRRAMMKVNLTHA